MTKSSTARLFAGLVVFSCAGVFSPGCDSSGNGSGPGTGGSGTGHGGSGGQTGFGGAGGSSVGGAGGGAGNQGGAGSGGSSVGGTGGGGNQGGTGGAGGGQGGSDAGYSTYADARADALADRDAGSDTRAGRDADASYDGSITGECTEGTELVYVVDQNNMFYSFDPLANASSAFKQVGTGPLSCPSGGQPYSMSVDRNGWAYVLFGPPCIGINRVDIKTGACKGLISFTCGTSDFSDFGMGYVTDGPDTLEEKLYIANLDQPSQLATLDVKTGKVNVVGSITYAGGEFTGNSLGQLWGFFPRESPPIVAQIDKTNGQAIKDQIFPLSSLSNSAAAWAFAHWGGAYYIFYKTYEESSTSVYKLQGGVLTTHISGSGKLIVGAGVSTCAPIYE